MRVRVDGVIKDVDWVKVLENGTVKIQYTKGKERVITDSEVRNIEILSDEFNKKIR